MRSEVRKGRSAGTGPGFLSGTMSTSPEPCQDLSGCSLNCMLQNCHHIASHSLKWPLFIPLRALNTPSRDNEGALNTAWEIFLPGISDKMLPKFICTEKLRIQVSEGRFCMQEGTKFWPKATKHCQDLLLLILPPWLQSAQGVALLIRKQKI